MSRFCRKHIGLRTDEELQTYLKQQTEKLTKAGDPRSLEGRRATMNLREVRAELRKRQEAIKPEGQKQV